MQPITSIIIPTQNRIKLLTKAVDTIIRQTDNRWELIIVDDKSTDSTRQYISNLQEKFSNIKYQYNDSTKTGAPVCRNIGLNKAQCDYIMFMDSDDLMAPYCIGDRIKALNQFPSYDMLLFEALEFDNSSPNYHRLRTIFGCQNPLEQFLAFEAVWQTSCVLWKKSAIQALHGWNEEMNSWQDPDLHIRALLSGLSYKWVKTLPHTFIRMHHDASRITGKVTSDKLINQLHSFINTRNQLLNHKSELKFDFIPVLCNRLEQLNTRKELKLFIAELAVYKTASFKLFMLYIYCQLLCRTLNTKLHVWVLRLRLLRWPIARRNFYTIRPKLNRNQISDLCSELDDDFWHGEIEFLAKNC